MRRGPTNNGEGFSVSAYFECFMKGVWGREGPIHHEGSFVSADFKCFRKGVLG